MSEKKTCAECKYLLTNERDGYKYKCDYYSDMYVYADEEACSHFWEDNYRSQSEVDSLSSSTTCFFTTACMISMNENFDDKCYELESIRKIRDRFYDKYTDDIKFYYENAPYVVKAINALSNSTEIWNYLYNELVLKTVRLIEAQNFDEAYSHYKSVSIKLFEQYHPECLKNITNK